MRNPLVSIIIVNWNGGEVFKNCLSSLSKIDYPNWELVVVDNGSTDGSDSEAEKLIKLTKIIRNKKNVGFARANNQGVEIAKGKYILLLNNDTKVEPDFLTKLVDRIETDSTLGVVQPKICNMRKPGYLDNAGSFPTRLGFFHHWGFLEKDGKEFEREKEIFSAKGACILIRRDVVEKLGLFDPDFISYFEETDFCWRVWLSGWRVLFYPKAKIHHMVGYTIRRLDVGNINFHHYKNRISSLIKNLEIGNLLIILPLHLFFSFGIASFFLLRLKFKNFGMIISAMLWNVFNLGKILEKRKKIQVLRKVSDKELFDKLMWPISWRRFFADLKRVEEDIERRAY